MMSKFIFLTLNEASYTILLIEITFQKLKHIWMIFTKMCLTWNNWQYIEGYSSASVRFFQITL
jgi:hypothetical protein